jgi:zinc protease
MHTMICRVVAAALILGTSFVVKADAQPLAVTRATLANGLQVIVVNDPLAPVVTTMLNYKVGSNEQSIDGQAHALEHMMFRGSESLSVNQFMDTVGVTGGNFDADTQDAVTQYFFTVPSQYLDIALRLERSRASGLSITQGQWDQEKGAITQEVTQDNSNATYRLFEKMQRRMLGGTPYAKNGLGTVDSFAHQVNAKNLRAFYDAWYHPNNAVFVIVGDVDGPSTVAKVKDLFGDLPAAKLPARPEVQLQPMKAALYRDTSDQPYTAALLGYRMPGFDSKDNAAAQILADVLNSQRGDLFALAASGKAYGVEFFVQGYRKVSVGAAFIAVPTTTKAEDAAAWVRGVINGYRKNGIPADLVAAAKLREIADLEQNRTSISDLANQWSAAVASQGLKSPDDMLADFQRVSVDDVNRVLRKWLDNSTAVVAYAVPKNSGAVSSGSTEMAKENVSVPPSKHEPLPAFAQRVLDHLSVPKQTLAPVDTTLANGMRLIVQTEQTANYVTVVGSILNNPQVQEPAGKEGVGSVETDLLPYGTTTYDRIAYQQQLDAIAASVHGGTNFSLSVPSSGFDRGVQLLADDELHPAYDPKYFAIVQSQGLKSVTDEQNSPDHLAEVALANALYPLGDPLRRFATPESIKAITLDDVKAWHAGAYRPDLTTLVVIGNVTPEQAKATVEKYFGGWSATGPKPTVYPSPVPLNDAKTVNVPANGRVQSSVELVQNLELHRTDVEWPALQVANTALTGGFYSSLLYHDLREVHGFAYYVGSSVVAGKYRSTFRINYASDPQNVVPSQQQIVAVLNNLQNDGLEPDRLLRAKALLMGEVPIREASFSGVGDLLIDYALRGLPLDQNLIDAKNELDVTETSLKAAVGKYVRPSGFVRVVTGPAPK